MLAVTICLVLSVLSVSTEAYCNIKGYYWRDFTGEMPSDALRGGTDANGKPIYIAQIFDQYLIPAKIYSGEKIAYYEFGGQEYKVTDNIRIKILCTQYPERFEWIPTNNDDIKLLTDKQLVIGGYEPGCTTYIGRAESGNEVLVGKLLVDIQPVYAGLHTTKNGKGTRHTSFQALAYNSCA